MSNAELPEFAKFIEGLSTSIQGYAIVIASVGTLSMALVDVLKGIFRLRGLFLKSMIEKWINDQTTGDKNKIKDELLYLAAGDREDAVAWDWWDQPEERVFPRIHAAAQTALDFPTDYLSLYEFLTQGLTGSEAWTNGAKDWRSRAGKVADQTAANDLADIRTRLGNAVTRRIETLQMKAEWYWAKASQVGAFLISLTIFIAYYCTYGISLWKALLTGVLAGLLAPFAKDLVSRISQVQPRSRL